MADSHYLNIHIRLDAACDAAAVLASRDIDGNLLRLGDTCVPHITLMLAKFCGDCSIEEAAARVLAAMVPVAGSGEVEVLMRAGPPALAGTYLFWDAESTPPLAALCERVQLAVAPLLAKPQQVPPWVASLPANEQEVRLAYLAKYGTVNAREYYRPHATIGVTAAPLTPGAASAPFIRGATFVAAAVHVAPAGEYGVVLPRDLGAVRLRAPFITRHRGMALAAALALGGALAALCVGKAH